MELDRQWMYWKHVVSRKEIYGTRRATQAVRWHRGMRWPAMTLSEHGFVHYDDCIGWTGLRLWV